MAKIYGAFGNYSTAMVRMLALLNDSETPVGIGTFDGIFERVEKGSIRSCLEEGIFRSRKSDYVVGINYRVEYERSNNGPESYDKTTIIMDADLQGKYSELKGKLTKYDDKSNSDGMLFAYGINEEGNAFFKKVFFPWAAVWASDDAPGHIFLGSFQNKLHISDNYEGAIYFSSDMEPLQILGLTPYVIQENVVMKFNTETLQYTFANTESVNSSTKSTAIVTIPQTGKEDIDDTGFYGV